MTSLPDQPQGAGGPEHLEVRLPAIDALVALGWDREQLRWEPEWRVPQTPHDAAKRESSERFASWPVDLAIFDDPSHANDWQHVRVICEFKKPTLTEGVSQLEIYLSREPRARLGFWSNGTENVRVYKLPDGNYKHVRNAGLPEPDESLELASERPLKFGDLRVPSSGQLRSVFARLLDVVVARDSRATRSESQLDELSNLLLLKLESDTNGQLSPEQNLEFQLSAQGEHATSVKIRDAFSALTKFRPEVFTDGESELALDDHTIQDVVFELSGLNLISVHPEAISSAFQIFRRANLKAGLGQYFTPQRVIAAAVEMMEIQPSDKIIDPACGTGGFLVEAFLSITEKGKASGSMSEAAARTWAHRQVFGVDKDSINVKLARALMVSMGDGSIHIHSGDSIRADRWAKDYPHLVAPLADGSFSVVLTNPPFGQNLKIAKSDSQRNKYSIAMKGGRNYQDLEIGLIFMERAHRLLMKGGRLGIILPETYFFSSSYKWFETWLSERFILRGILNIPMEAFQGFCRAKTNFYVMEKR